MIAQTRQVFLDFKMSNCESVTDLSCVQLFGSSENWEAFVWTESFGDIRKSNLGFELGWRRRSEAHS